MPNILKKLFEKSSSTLQSRRRRGASDGAQSWNTGVDLLASPRIGPSRLPNSSEDPQVKEDLAELAGELLSRLEVRDHSGGEKTMRRLLRELQDRAGHSRSSINRSPSVGSVGAVRVDSFPGTRGGSSAQRTDTTHSQAEVDGQKVIMALTTALAKVALIVRADSISPGAQQTARRCEAALEGQLGDLKEILVYLDRGRFPALRTLLQVYEKVNFQLQQGKEDVNGATTKDGLSVIVDILEQGPDYLISTFLLELILHHSFTIASSLHAAINKVIEVTLSGPHDGTPAASDATEDFVRAQESIVALCASVASDELDDAVSREAYRIIGILLENLKRRTDTLPSPAIPRQADDEARSISPSLRSISPGLSRPPSVSPLSSRGSPLPEAYKPYQDVSELQAQFGSGSAVPSPTIPRFLTASAIGSPADPLPPSARETPTAPLSPVPESSSSSLSLFEYRDQLLTRSAMNLVLKQEALAMADSSGQYAGEVSWDALRNAWIPKWAEKLRPSDLAEGEVPDLNPASYRIRGGDDWGNRVGWDDLGLMYYEEEPEFELKD